MEGPAESTQFKCDTPQSPGIFLPVIATNKELY